MPLSGNAEATNINILSLADKMLRKDTKLLHLQIPSAAWETTSQKLQISHM